MQEKDEVYDLSERLPMHNVDCCGLTVVIGFHFTRIKLYMEKSTN